MPSFKVEKHWNVTPVDLKAPISLAFSCMGYWGTNQHPFSWQSATWRLQTAFKNERNAKKEVEVGVAGMGKKGSLLICVDASAVLAKPRSTFPFREEQNSQEGFPRCKMSFHSTSDSLWQPIMPRCGDTVMPGNGGKKKSDWSTWIATHWGLQGLFIYVLFIIIIIFWLWLRCAKIVAIWKWHT